MEVNLLYGSNGLIADFPEDRTSVVRARETPPIEDETGCVLRALTDRTPRTNWQHDSPSEKDLVLIGRALSGNESRVPSGS